MEFLCSWLEYEYLCVWFTTRPMLWNARLHLHVAVMTIHIVFWCSYCTSELFTYSESMCVVDVFNKAIRGKGMGHRSLLSAAGGSQCCSVAEAGLVPWQLSSGADLTHFVLPISFFRQGSISHVCHRTSPGCGIRKGSVRKWEAISVLCLTMSYLLSMSPLPSFLGLSARCLMGGCACV